MQKTNDKSKKKQIADGGTVPMHMGREAPSTSLAEIVAKNQSIRNTSGNCRTRLLGFKRQTACIGMTSA